MHRIDTTLDQDRWRYKCIECGSTDWRVHDGTIGCRRCGVTLRALLDADPETEVRLVYEAVRERRSF